MGRFGGRQPPPNPGRPGAGQLDNSPFVELSGSQLDNWTTGQLTSLPIVQLAGLPGNWTTGKLRSCAIVQLSGSPVCPDNWATGHRAHWRAVQLSSSRRRRWARTTGQLDNWTTRGWSECPVVPMYRVLLVPRNRITVLLSDRATPPPDHYATGLLPDQAIARGLYPRERAVARCLRLLEAGCGSPPPENNCGDSRCSPRPPHPGPELCLHKYAAKPQLPASAMAPRGRGRRATAARWRRAAAARWRRAVAARWRRAVAARWRRVVAAR